MAQLEKLLDDVGLERDERIAYLTLALAGSGTPPSLLNLSRKLEWSIGEGRMYSALDSLFAKQLVEASTQRPKIYTFPKDYAARLTQMLEDNHNAKMKIKETFQEMFDRRLSRPLTLSPVMVDPIASGRYDSQIESRFHLRTRGMFARVSDKGKIDIMTSRFHWENRVHLELEEALRKNAKVRVLLSNGILDRKSDYFANLVALHKSYPGLLELHDDKHLSQLRVSTVDYREAIVVMRGQTTGKVEEELIAGFYTDNEDFLREFIQPIFEMRFKASQRIAL